MFTIGLRYRAAGAKEKHFTTVYLTLATRNVINVKLSD